MYFDANNLPSSFLPGDRVRTHCGLYDHVGTVSRCRKIYASSRKFGILCEVSPKEFSGGRPVMNDGFIGLRSREAVLRHLEARLGQEYSFFNANCEHQNNSAHGLGSVSPQLQAMFGILIFGSGLFLLSRPGSLS